MCKSVLMDVQRPSCISRNEAFIFVRSPRAWFYVNQPHRANGNQRFAAILFSTGCQREMACIVYKALLLFCINKHLRGADKERSAASARHCRNISASGGARRLEKLGISKEPSPLPRGWYGNEGITMKTRSLSLVVHERRRRSRQQDSERGR